jgi:CRISPR/Cas system-associated exonuclease Cas4 (RecB family)
VPSAGDVERFGYCAHNWWLARAGHAGKDGDGVAAHAEKGEAQRHVERHKRDAKGWLRWSFIILAVAGSVTFLGLELVFLRQHPQHLAFLLTALVMVSMSSGLFVLAALSERAAHKRLRTAGLVPGTLVDTDLSGAGELLSDDEWGIQGRPDYVIRTQDGVIPVEVKSGRTPERPHENHVLQLACYLRLLEAKTGSPPVYGLITYPEGTFRVEWDDDVQRYLRGTLARMERAVAEGRADRDHEHVGRCRGCARRAVCDERLA